MTLTVEPDAVTDTYPLSQEQLGLWFVHRALPESAAYQLGMAVRIKSSVDVPALRRSMQALVNHYPSLRTSISAGPSGRPLQTVHPHSELPFKQHDASLLSDDELRRQVTEHYAAPFDLGRAPLIRVHLFTRREDDHVLLLTFHHIIFDGHSFWIFLRELRKLYAAELSGIPHSPPPARRTYRDFVAWQEAMLAGPEGDAHLTFWKEYLHGAPTVLDLPADGPRPSRPPGTGDTLSLRLDEALMARVIAFSKESGVGLDDVMLSAYQILLHRYSSQDDLLIGCLTAGRRSLDFARVGGLFSKPLVLRSVFSPTVTFRELVARQHAAKTSAFEHQDYPYFKLVGQLPMDRDPRHMPLIQVAFNFYKMPRSEQFEELFVVDFESELLDFGGLLMTSYGLKQAQGQFELALEVAEGQGKYWAQFKYSTALFDESTMARMAGHYQNVLEGMASAPDARVSTFDFRTEAERQLLGAPPPLAAAFPPPGASGLSRLFEAQVERNPAAIAVVFQDQRLTYDDLNRRADALARRLRALGVGPDVVVGVCMTRSSAMVVALLAVSKAGGAYLPLDPDFPAARLAFIVEDASPAVLLTEAALVDRLPAHGARAVLIDEAATVVSAGSVDVDKGVKPERDAEAAHPPSSPDDLAYTIYTSGSTGKPKGVLVSNGALTNFLLAMQERPGMSERDVLLAVTTLSFDIAALELFLPLITGARVVIASKATTRDGRELARAIDTHAVTMMQATPATWQLLLDSGWQGAPNLRALSGGDALSRTLANRLLERVAAVWNMYGPTENTIWSTVHDVDAGTGPVPIGRPIQNTTAVILDRMLQPVPIGVTGMLYLGGSGVARGYLGRPDLTRDAFVPDPFSAVPGARLYRTGDLARYLASGDIEFLGRVDDQAKIRGFRVELGEIESVLIQHESVQDAVALVTDAGAGHPRLVAYLVMERGATAVLEELRAWAESQLPDYMIPSAFLTIDRFPLTSVGKIDRPALKALASSRVQSSGTTVAPASPTERTLATIWQSVLGTDHVGVTEKFYDSGGDSLALAEMLTRAERTFQLELPVRLGVQHQTIRDLAREIDRLAVTPGPHDVAAGRVSAEQVHEATAAAARLRRKPFLQGTLVGLHRLVVPMLGRIEVEGAEHLPADGPLIIAANHVNWLDLPFLLGILGQKVTRFSSAPAFVVAHRWKALFHQYLKQIGLPVYVRRSEGDGESLRQLLAVLRANGVIVITPEGTFNGGALIQARTGVARLATQAPAPVLPVVLYGQERALHCWLRLRRAPMRVRIATPIHLPAGDWSQVQLRQQADSVMEAMAELLPAGYRGVYAGADRSETS